MAMKINDDSMYLEIDGASAGSARGAKDPGGLLVISKSSAAVGVGL